jgi:hypothetical protein
MVFIQNEVEPDVFTPGKKEVIDEMFAMKKRIPWEKIAKFIKTENSNDKSDLKAYRCGHYFVNKSGSSLELKPIGHLPGVKEGDLK